MASKSDDARSDSAGSEPAQSTNARNRRNAPAEAKSSAAAGAASSGSRDADEPSTYGDKQLDADDASNADRGSAGASSVDASSVDASNVDPSNTSQALGEQETSDSSSVDQGLAGTDVLQRLVKRAVAESLHPAARGAPRSQVVIDATAKLERMLAQYGDIESLRQRLAEQRDALGIELSRLRSAVVARRGFLEAESDVSVWPVDPERWRTLRWRVQARLAALADSVADSVAGSVAGSVVGRASAESARASSDSLRVAQPAGPARIAAQEVLDLFAKERAASLAELRRRSDAEVVQLERRLSALASTVEQAERVLEVLREAPLESGGVASYFREHEGLDSQARNRELKLAMLDGVYRQNVELQRGEE